MKFNDRLLCILAGILAIYVGTNVVSMDNPVIFRHGYIFSTFHWVGWLFIPFGCAMLTTNIYGLFTDRKKRLAAIARCKALRKQEAEAAKAEDNQHP